MTCWFNELHTYQGNMHIYFYLYIIQQCIMIVYENIRPNFQIFGKPYRSLDWVSNSFKFSIYFVFHVAVVFLFFCLLCKPYYVCVLSVCVKEGKINSVKPLSPLSSPSLERF